MIRKILVQLTAGVLTVLLATSFCFAGENTEAYDPAEVSSAGESEIMPMTIGISSMRASLSFNGADAICALNMFADTIKLLKAIMSVKLQRKSGSTYVTVKNWRDEAPVRMPPATLNSSADLPSLIAGHTGSKWTAKCIREAVWWTRLVS